MLEPRLSNIDVGIVTGIAEYGVRALVEQYGIEALDAPVNTIFRIGPGYRAGLGNLLWYRNGVLQDITSGDYLETDNRTITMAAGMAAIDRLLGIVIAEDIGMGGLVIVDRPPAGAGAGPYTISLPIVNAEELFVYLNGILQAEGALEDYTVNVALNQLTFNAAIPPASTIVCVVVRGGVQGLRSRELFFNQGPFPGAVAVADEMDKNNNAILVYINGQIQSENFDYIVTDPFTLNITRIIGGVNNRVEIVQIAKSQDTGWRE